MKIAARRTASRAKAVDRLIRLPTEGGYLRVSRGGPRSQSISDPVNFGRPMAERCPRCYAELPEDARWVCPTCGFTLRTPAVSKVGIFVMFLGLILLAGYVMGPESLGLTSGLVPTDLADLMIANMAEMVVGTFALGMFLILVGALIVRSAKNRVSAA